MDRSTVITLCSATYTEDELGQKIPTWTDREVFAQTASINGREWFEAGRNGINAELKLTMFRFDYEGETECIVDGIRYGVYRTYLGRGDNIELYLERKAGVNNVQQDR